MINLIKSFSLSPPPFCTSFDSDGNCIGCFPEIIGVGSSPHNSALHISKSEASVCSAAIPVGGPFTHSYFEFRRTRKSLSRGE